MKRASLAWLIVLMTFTVACARRPRPTLVAPTSTSAQPTATFVQPAIASTRSPQPSPTMTRAGVASPTATRVTPLDYPFDKKNMFFGTGSIRRPEDAALAQDLGITWVSGQPLVVWFAVEPTPGIYEWSQIDAEIKQVQALGIDITMALHPINVFGANRTQLLERVKAQGGNVSNMSFAIQTFLRDSPESKQWKLYPHAETLPLWLDFIRAAVDRYDGDGKNDLPGLRYPVRNWHFVQEFPMPDWDNAQTYVQVLKQTYTAIKNENPEARVILVGLAGNYARYFAFADGLIQDEDAGVVKGVKRPRQAIAANPALKREKSEFEYILREGKGYFDIADIHLYEEKDTFIEGKIEWLKRKMQEFGYSTPIWSLEGGGPHRDPPGKPTRFGDPYFGDWSAKENAEFVVKLHVMGAAKGMARYHWDLSSTDDTDYWNGPWTVMGLTTSRRVKKPSYYAFKTMTDKLKDFESIKDVSAENTRLFEFAVGNRKVYVAWSSDATPRVYDVSRWLGNTQVIVTPIVTQTQADGKPITPPTQQVSSTAVLLSTTPVFINTD